MTILQRQNEALVTQLQVAETELGAMQQTVAWHLVDSAASNLVDSETSKQLVEEQEYAMQLESELESKTMTIQIGILPSTHSAACCNQ